MNFVADKSIAVPELRGFLVERDFGSGSESPEKARSGSLADAFDLIKSSNERAREVSEYSKACCGSHARVLVADGYIVSALLGVEKAVPVLLLQNYRTVLFKEAENLGQLASDGGATEVEQSRHVGRHEEFYNAVRYFLTNKSKVSVEASVAVSYPRVEANCLCELTREASHALSAHMRSINACEAAFIVSLN